MHDQSEAYDQYDADVSTDAPETDGPAVPVEVVGPVETIDRPALSLATEQISLQANIPVRLVGAVHDRESVLIKATGAQVFIGNQTVTPGSGYMLDIGESVVLTARCALYAVATGTGATLYILSQHRAGGLS